MNWPPMLSIPIIYNMHESSSNLHKQCLHHGRRSVSLLADRPTASSRFSTCHRLSSSLSFRPSLSPGLPVCVGPLSLHDKCLPPAACCIQMMDAPLTFRPWILRTL